MDLIFAGIFLLASLVVAALFVRGFLRLLRFGAPPGPGSSAQP